MAGARGRSGTRAGPGAPAAVPTASPGDLAERVTRLEQALGDAGAALARAGGIALDASTAAPPPGQPTRAARKGVRSVIQLGLAAVPGVIVSRMAGWSPEAAGWITIAIAPLVTFAQNELEDLLVIPAILRQPSPKGPRAEAKMVARRAARAAGPPPVG